MTILRLMLAAIGALHWAGCAARPPLSSPPPCALLEVAGLGGTATGQCLWVGNRVLTSAHGFAMFGADYMPHEVRLDGQRAHVSGFRAGKFIPAGAAAITNRNVERDGPEDWAAFEVDLRRGSALPVRFAGAAADPGDTVYLVGYDPGVDFRSLVAIPLRVTGARIMGRPLPDRLIAAIPPAGRNLSGFSGGFVGRYDSARREWECTGQFISTGYGSYTERTILGSICHRVEDCTIVRPPDDVVAWLMIGPTAGDALVEDRRDPD